MTEQDHGSSQADAQVSSIVEMVEALNGPDQEEAMQRIYEDPLEVQVRGPWHSPGTDPGPACEFSILLCTGGPAVRIVGDLHESGYPETCSVEYQDWGTPWTRRHISDDERAAVLTYCQYLLPS